VSAAEFSVQLKKLFSFERTLLLIFIIAIFLRFFLLDLKLFHHDEAIHAWFSWELLTKGTWIYDPMYHGPLLYYLTAGMFSLFGDSDLVGRILPSLFGTLLIPLVYGIYRLGYLDQTQTLLASLFIAISPDMVYFSRFLRHDIFMLYFTFLLVVALFAYFEKGKTRFALLAAIALAGALSLKEEMPIFALIFGVYFCYAIWKGRYTLPVQWKKDLLLGTIVLVFLMSALYSAWGAHIETLIGQNFDLHTTGWYRAIEHWTAMHNQQRLGGPWFFYILLILLYEVPIFILAIIGTLQFLIKGDQLKEAFTSIWYRIRRQSIQTKLHDIIERSTMQLKTRFSPVVLNKQEEFVRFCIIWMLLTMAMYAYIGEKVPWLLIPQLLPMIFVAIYKLNTAKIAVAFIGCIFLFVVMWHVAFVPADVNEPIVQVQNSEEMREVMRLMDESDRVVLASKDYWPLPWYYRGEKWNKITFYGQRVDESTLQKSNADLIILHDAESYSYISGYEKKTYKLSYWFSVWDNQDRMGEYYFTRDGKMGSINLDVFIRNRTNST
jgi:uncharacterized protein (TIGR03663 family)